MAINFNSFTEGTISNIQSNDYVVGFDNTSPGGERKWTVSTIANAVLSANSVGATQITNGSVTATKLGTTEQKQICKAWGVFYGAPPAAILGNYNIAGIDRVAQGRYTITFQNPMLNVNYAIVVSSVQIGSGWAMPVWHYAGKTINTFEIYFGDADAPGSYYDSANFSVVVFGS